MVKFSSGEKMRQGPPPPQTPEQKAALKKRKEEIETYQAGRKARAQDTQRKVILGACLQRLVIMGDKQALAVYRRIVPEMVDERRRKIFE